MTRLLFALVFALHVATCSSSEDSSHSIADKGDDKGDILNDEDDIISNDHGHSVNVLLPLCTILFIGIAIQLFFSRHFPKVPYTLLMGLIGIALGVEHALSGFHGQWWHGVDVLVRYLTLLTSCR